MSNNAFPLLFPLYAKEKSRNSFSQKSVFITLFSPGIREITNGVWNYLWKNCCWQFCRLIIYRCNRNLPKVGPWTLSRKRVIYSYDRSCNPPSFLHSIVDLVNCTRSITRSRLKFARPYRFVEVASNLYRS